MTPQTTAPILIVWLMTVALPGSSQGASAERLRGTIGPSGLQAVFPDEVRCPEIASPFGSPTRYDGSARPKSAFGGRHGGIDISLAEGTPLLALAAGTLVSKGEGGQMEGIYLWLSHSPEQTGLGYWVYSKYQHLQALSESAISASVAVGAVVARSGRTGTIGGHYGAHGYPHLHLTTLKSSRGDLPVGSRGQVRAAELMDPLLMYREAGIKSKESTDSRSDEQAVRIPYPTTEGQVRPQGTRVVWPVACGLR